MTTTSASASARRPASVSSPTSPGPPPTSTTRPACARRCRRSTRPSRSWVGDGVAHGDRAPRVRRARRDDADQDVALLGGRRRAGRAVGAGAGVDAERLALRRPTPSTAASVARSPVAVCTSQAPSRSDSLHLAGAPLDQAPAVQVEEHLAQLRRDDHHAGGVGEQRLHAARGDRSATDDEHAPAGQLRARASWS